MDVKVIEVRDDGIFIPIVAVRLGSNKPSVRYLLSMAGYGKHHVEQQKFVMVIKLSGPKVEYAPSAWGDRTMSVAHRELQDNWGRYETGDVLDVCYVLGERETPRSSQREMEDQNE